MILPGRVVLLVLVLAVLACSGCTQPVTPAVPMTADATPGSTPLPGISPPAVLPKQDTFVTTPVTLPAAPDPARTTPLPAPSAGNLQPGGFVRYTGPEYSLDYPAGWNTSTTILPLREYHRIDPHDCTVTYAYNLDQEIRTFSSGYGSTLFYAEIVHTDRDIWPRSLSGQVAYEEIVNAVLGNPESCANLEGNEAFTIAGISQVPLEGVSYTGIRVDFAKISLTGFAVGKGSAYIVPGKNYRGVFTFYSTSPDSEAQASLANSMFDSLHLDPGF